MLLRLVLLFTPPHRWLSTLRTGVIRCCFFLIVCQCSKPTIIPCIVFRESCACKSNDPVRQFCKWCVSLLILNRLPSSKHILSLLKTSVWVGYHRTCSDCFESPFYETYKKRTKQTLGMHVFWQCIPTNQGKRIPAFPNRKAGAWQAEMPLSKLYSFFDQKSKPDQKNSQAWHRSEDGRVCGPIPCLIYVCNLKPIEH